MGKPEKHLDIKQPLGGDIFCPKADGFQSDIRLHVMKSTQKAPEGRKGCMRYVKKMVIAIGLLVVVSLIVTGSMASGITQEVVQDEATCQIVDYRDSSGLVWLQVGDTGSKILAEAAQKKTQELEQIARQQEEERQQRERESQQPTLSYSGGYSQPTTYQSGSTSWDSMAVNCEAKGQADTWHTNTGNGYYGGLQFDPPTWDIYGNSACAEASDCSREEQIAAAERVPYDAWPNC